MMASVSGLKLSSSTREDKLKYHQMILTGALKTWKFHKSFSDGLSGQEFT